VIESISNIKSTQQNNLLIKFINYFRLLGLEGLIWIFALMYLAIFINPLHTHFTICPLSNLGFEHCPGCGLGNSIAFLFRGNFTQSFNSHILGIPAVIIIIHRIVSLIKFNLNNR
jgi:hypothetical protein